MGRKSKEKPSFFKVLSNMDFTKLLRLPAVLLRRNDVSENVVIMMRGAYAYAYSGRKWNVKVERMESGVFCFTEGWQSLLKMQKQLIKMARSDSEHQSASFMIFYQGEFSSNLRIPTKFATKYRRVVNQASVMLETSDDSEKCWEVKIKNMNGDYYMKDGWSEFMKDNQIHDTDFVTFRLVAQSSFEVTIYRSDGCPRVLTSPTTTSDDVNKSGRGRGSPPTRKRKKRRSNPLYFEICLKNYQNSRICLPKEFTVAASMKEKTDVRVEYKDVRTPNNQNKNWENVVVDHRPDCYRVDLAKGWGRFRKLNKLVYGKVYSFEFKPNQNVIHVKEVK